MKYIAIVMLLTFYGCGSQKEVTPNIINTHTSSVDTFYVDGKPVLIHRIDSVFIECTRPHTKVEARQNARSERQENRIKNRKDGRDAKNENKADKRDIKVKLKQEDTKKSEARQSTKQVKSKNKKEVKIERAKNREVFWFFFGLAMGLFLFLIFKGPIKLRAGIHE